MDRLLLVILVAAVLALPSVMPVSWARVIAVEQEPLPALDPQANLAGVWVLNRDESDDPQGRVPAAAGQSGQGPGGRGGLGAPGGGGRGGFGGQHRGAGRGDPEQMRERMEQIRTGMQELLAAPGRMTIVEDGTEIHVTSGDGRVMRLMPDGKAHAGLAGNGLEVKRKANWQDGKLVVEIALPMGGPLTQTYETRFDGAQLVVTTEMRGAGRGPRGSGDDPAGLTWRRVYDRQAS